MDRLLTVAEAAGLLRLSVYTLQEYARKGVVPAVKVGRGWRFPEAALVGWLARRGPSQPASDGCFLARDSAGLSTSLASTEAGTYVANHLDRERRAAVSALRGIRERGKPFRVQELVDAARVELDARIDRTLKGDRRR